MALYLFNCPQYVIAYFGALKAGAKITPISPVYTSKEVKHQLQDGDAKTVICEDLLYDNVASAGVEFDNVIFSNIGDFLPHLKKHFGRGAMGKAYQGLSAPTPEVVETGRTPWFQGAGGHVPPQAPGIKHDPFTDFAALPYTGDPPVCPRPPC